MARSFPTGKCSVKWITSLPLLLSLVCFCTVPVVLRSPQEPYTVIRWEGGTFVYVTYYWQGRSIEEARELIRRFAQWAKEKNVLDVPMGRFPEYSIWQLGFLSLAGRIDTETFEGYPIEQMEIPEGGYASLKLTGEPGSLRFYRQEFELMLQEDGFVVESPAYEVYAGMLTDTLQSQTGVYEIRYLIGAAEDLME